MNMNMNSGKETDKKINKSPTTKGTARTSPMTPPQKNSPFNSTIDGKKAVALKPAAPVSPTPAAAEKVLAIASKVKDARTPAPQTFALLAESSAARTPNVTAAEGKRISTPKPTMPTPKVTTIEVKVDVGFGNAVYLRGQGPGLSWERGVPCECVNRDTWRWTAPAAEKLTVKPLLNDSVWARGADLVIAPGEQAEVVPAF